MSAPSAPSRRLDERLEEIEFMRSFGMSWERVAERCGLSADALEGTLRRARAAGLTLPE